MSQHIISDIDSLIQMEMEALARLHALKNLMNIHMALKQKHAQSAQTIQTRCACHSRDDPVVARNIITDFEAEADTSQSLLRQTHELIHLNIQGLAAAEQKQLQLRHRLAWLVDYVA